MAAADRGLTVASGIENLGTFPADLTKAGRELVPREVALVRDRATLGVLGRVVLATPVDTGFHRASWNASIGTPDERTPAPGAESYAPPATPLALPPAGPFEPGYVTNAAPAIVFLNEGSSQQAPAHFVQRAIEEEVAALQGGR
jgi:hypothetical protein